MQLIQKKYLWKHKAANKNQITKKIRNVLLFYHNYDSLDVEMIQCYLMKLAVVSNMLEHL